MYEPNVEVRNRHNLILSIQDGVVLYCDENRKSMMYPEIRQSGTGDADSWFHHRICSFIFTCFARISS